MAVIPVKFIGTAQFGRVNAELAKLATGLQAVETQRAKMLSGTGAMGNEAAHAANVKRLSGEYANLTKAMRSMKGATIEQVGNANIISDQTRLIQDQKVKVGDLNRSMRLSGEIAREQWSISKSMIQTYHDQGGTMRTQLIKPSADFASRWDMAFTRMGVRSQILKSVSRDIVNIGKNTQWAGRQMFVGLAVPLGILGGLAVKTYLEFEKQIVGVAKVYDTQTDNVSGELEKLKQDTRDTATELASSFGVSIESTAELAAGFAAAGVQGQRLQDDVKATQKLAVLGEIDTQTAMQATIAVQSVYHKSSSELAETWARLNVIENQTTVTTAELTNAFPQAINTVSSLGGSVEYLSAMLAGMKSMGVANMRKGATAIRSGMASLLSPTKEAINAFDDFGISLTDIVANNKGDIQGMMEALSAAVQPLGAQNTTKLYDTLFGKFRFEEMQALTKSIQDVGGAYHKSVEVMGMSTSEAMAKSNQELERFVNSAPQQFERLKRGIEAELAGMGDDILPMVNTIAGGILSILKGFNNWDEKWKKAAVVVAGLTIAAAAFVMTAGVLLNFFGTGAVLVSRFMGGIARLAGGYKGLTTAQQRVSQSIPSRALASFRGEADHTTQQIMKMTEALQAQIAALNGQSEAAMLAANPGAKLRQSSVASTAAVTAGMRPTAASISIPTPQGTGPVSSIAGHMEETNQAVAKQNGLAARTGQIWEDNGKSITRAASSATFLVAMITSMTTEAGGAANGIANIALMASLALPTIGHFAKGTISHLRRVKGEAKGAAAAMAMLQGSKAGIAGLAAAGLFAGVITLYQKAQARDESMRNSVDQTKGVVESLGYQWRDVGTYIDKAGKQVDNYVNAADKLPDTAPDVQKRIDALKGDQEELAKYIKERTMASFLASGGDAKVAEEMQKTLWAAADQIDTFNADASLHINWKNMPEVGAEFKNTLTDTVNDMADDIPVGSRVILAAEVDTTKINKFVEEMGHAMDAFPEKSEQIATDAMTAFRDRFYYDLIEHEPKIVKMFQDMGYKVKDLNDVWNVMSTRSGEVNKKLEGQNSEFGRLVTDGYNPTAEASKALSDKFNVLGGNSSNLASVLKIAVTQNLQKVNSESDNAGTGIKRFGEMVKSASFGNNLDEITASLQGIEMASEDTKKAMDTLISAQKEAGAAAMSTAIDAAMRQFDDMAQRKIDAIDKEKEAVEKRYEAEKEAMDDRYDHEKQRMDDSFEARSEALKNDYELSKDRISNIYDAEIQKIEDDAEREKETLEERKKEIERLDEARQKAFDREISRIQRLAEAQNATIDFNAALATGDFDEAAKVLVNSQASEDRNAIDDSRTNAEDLKNPELKGIDDRINAIDNEVKQAKNIAEQKRDADLAAIDAVNKAREKALENEKRIAEAGFQARKEAAQRSLEEHKRVEIETLNVTSERQQRQTENERRRLEQELATLRASVPQTKAEYDGLIGQLEGIFGKYGVNVGIHAEGWKNVTRNAWTDAMVQAHAQIQNTIKWDQAGLYIANEIAGAISGMNFAQFSEWVKTGTIPAAGNFSGAGSPTGGARPAGNRMHTGGPLNDAKTYPGLKSNEVPIIGQKGEFMVRREVVQKPGMIQALHAINSGRADDLKMHSGGVVGGLATALPSMIATAMSQQIYQGINKSIATNTGGAHYVPGKGIWSPSGGTAQIGDAKGTTAEQQSNAQAIVTVGKQMGANQKDLIVSLMTALQESGLRNLNGGDRDSRGLFQQRPSQGWGTAAQVTNPQYAARKFFEALLRLPGRENMGLTQQAQAVQRSAYPNAYAKWENTARGLLGTAQVGATAQGSVGGGYVGKNLLEALQSGALYSNIGGGPTGAGFSRGGGRPGMANTLAAKAFIAGKWPSTRGGGSMDLNRGDSRSDHCLSFNTKVITKEGLKEIGSLAGTEQMLLTRDPYSKDEQGKWVKAPINEYGVEDVYDITLECMGQTKVIRASDHHNHYLAQKTTKYIKGSGRKNQKSDYVVETRVKKTTELKYGDRMATALPPAMNSIVIDNDAQKRSQKAWVVKNVEYSGQETVYCATVDETEAFVLEGNILTGNSRGKALDIFPGTALGRYASGAGLAQGWDIANYMIANPQQFGTKYVIWQKKINSGKGWGPYTRYGANPGPTLGHYDHVHLSVLHGGGIVGTDGEGRQVNLTKAMQEEGKKGGKGQIPFLRSGGKVIHDNTIANLHKNETVLTEPLSAKLERGINALANNSVGGGNKYEINLNINGEMTDKQIKMTGREVKRALQEVESNKGGSRRVN